MHLDPGGFVGARMGSDAGAGEVGRAVAHTRKSRHPCVVVWRAESI